MNFLGLARRSVLRKPVKSILLLIVVFVISTLLLAGMSGRNASIEVQDKTRQAIGAGFLLEKNDEYRAKRIEELSKEIGDKDGELDGYYQKKIVVNGSVNWNTGTTNVFETLDLKDIEKISETKGISDYNITTAVTAVNPVNFNRIEDKDTNMMMSNALNTTRTIPKKIIAPTGILFRSFLHMAVLKCQILFTFSE